MGSNKAWNSRVIKRVFEVGDLVTLSPDFRYSIARATVDFGRYIGIITKAFSNREYMVVWTNHPLHAFNEGMFNGDHLIKVENVDDSLMRNT
jgi:hypothetical protein